MYIFNESPFFLFLFSKVKTISSNKSLFFHLRANELFFFVIKNVYILSGKDLYLVLGLFPDSQVISVLISGLSVLQGRDADDAIKYTEWCWSANQDGKQLHRGTKLRSEILKTRNFQVTVKRTSTHLAPRASTRASRYSENAKKFLLDALTFKRQFTYENRLRHSTNERK